jgi:hypothetical protein
LKDVLQYSHVFIEIFWLFRTLTLSFLPSLPKIIPHTFHIFRCGPQLIRHRQGLFRHHLYHIIIGFLKDFQRVTKVGELAALVGLEGAVAV